MNMSQFLRELEADKVKIQKSIETGLKVEGYRLSNQLKSDLKAGSIAGKKAEPLREISKLYSRNRSQRNKPALAPLAKVVRYSAKKITGGLRLQVGFLDTISKRWRELAMKLQTGSTFPVSPGVREGLRKMGAGLQGKKRSRNRAAAKYFFIKKTTQDFQTPPRDIRGARMNKKEGRAHVQSQD